MADKYLEALETELEFAMGRQKYYEQQHNIPQSEYWRGIGVAFSWAKLCYERMVLKTEAIENE